MIDKAFKYITKPQIASESFFSFATDYYRDFYYKNPSFIKFSEFANIFPTLALVTTFAVKEPSIRRVIDPVVSNLNEKTIFFINNGLIILNSLLPSFINKERILMVVEVNNLANYFKKSSDNEFIKEENPSSLWKEYSPYIISTFMVFVAYSKIALLLKVLGFTLPLIYKHYFSNNDDLNADPLEEAIIALEPNNLLEKDDLPQTNFTDDLSCIFNTSFDSESYLPIISENSFYDYENLLNNNIYITIDNQTTLLVGSN